MKQKILFISHCILNTAAKVVRLEEAGKKEEEAKKRILIKALEEGVQLVQLPCPEFTLYGPDRWGHTREQFDNPFFREHCREILKPILVQMKAYLAPGKRERFSVLGLVGIDGSPSCGVSRTCIGYWGGEFSGRTDLEEIIATCHSVSGMGVMMEVLHEMMEEEGIRLPVKGLNPGCLQPVLDLISDIADKGKHFNSFEDKAQETEKL